MTQQQLSDMQRVSVERTLKTLFLWIVILAMALVGTWLGIGYWWWVQSLTPMPPASLRG